MMQWPFTISGSEALLEERRSELEVIRAEGLAGAFGDEGDAPASHTPPEEA
jgi:hypothetical protein